MADLLACDAFARSVARWQRAGGQGAQRGSGHTREHLERVEGSLGARDSYWRCVTVFCDTASW